MRFLCHSARRLLDRDCSIHGVPVVDSCAGTGMDGIFQVLAFYTGAVDRSTLTVGTCAGTPLLRGINKEV